MTTTSRRRPTMNAIIAIVVTAATIISSLLGVITTCNAAASSPPSQLKGRFPWQNSNSKSYSSSSPSSSSSSSSSSPLGAAPRGGGAVVSPVRKGSASSSSSSSSPVNNKRAPPPTGKKMMKKRVAPPRKRATTTSGGAAPILPEDGRTPKRGGGATTTTMAAATSSPAVATGETMPSIFRIPSEEKYDRYAAALAVTEGLRRVRDAEIASSGAGGGAGGLGGGRRSWLGIAGAGAGGGGEKKKGGGDSSSDYEENASSRREAKRKRAESAYLLQSARAVKSLGMTVAQFNQIGREVVSDPGLRERVSEQAYLYRVASAVNLDRVPLLDDPSSRDVPRSTEHEKHRVRLFARSVHEIEDLRSDQVEALRASLRVERFPPGFDLSDPNVRPLLHPEVRRACEMFPVRAEEIVKRHGLDSDEFNRMLEETRGNSIFRWRVQKYVEKAEEEKVKTNNKNNKA